MQKFLQFKSISKRISLYFLFFSISIENFAVFLHCSSPLQVSPPYIRSQHNYSNEKKSLERSKCGAQGRRRYFLGMDFHLPIPFRVKPSGDGTIRYENSRHFQVSSAATRGLYRCIS